MVNVYEMIKNLIQDIMNRQDVAAQFAADPQGVLAAQGITDHDLSGVDVYQLAGEVCETGGVPEGARSAWQGHSSGSSYSAPSGGSGGGYTPAPSGPAPATNSVDHVVQQLQTVTYVTYEDNDTITQTIIDASTDNSVDNSVSLDVSGEVHGGLDLDVDNANAVGDGSVATAGENNDVNAATGDGSQVFDHSLVGQANTGDNAVQAIGVDGPINTGTNSGIIADGDVNNAAVGNSGDVTQVQNQGDEAQFGFGDGDLTNQDNTITDSTLLNSNVGNEAGDGDFTQEAEIDLSRDQIRVDVPEDGGVMPPKMDREEVFETFDRSDYTSDSDAPSESATETFDAPS